MADQTEFMKDPARNFGDAVDAARAVARAAAAGAVRRIVFISSGAVYGDPPRDLTEIPEDFAGAPDVSRRTAGYGEAKRVCELLLRLTGREVRIARLFSALGPYQDLTSSFAVPDLIRQAARDGKIRLATDGSARRSYIYASDLAAFLWRLLLGDAPHDVYNVGSRDGIASVAEVAGIIAEIFGGIDVRRGTDAPPSPAYLPRLDRMYESFVPGVGLREGLVRTCQSLFARGLIERKPSLDVGSIGPPG
jgi:UDP-glucuronate decarboxylase